MKLTNADRYAILCARMRKLIECVDHFTGPDDRARFDLFPALEAVKEAALTSMREEGLGPDWKP